MLVASISVTRSSAIENRTGTPSGQVNQLSRPHILNGELVDFATVTSVRFSNAGERDPWSAFLFVCFFQTREYE